MAGVLKPKVITFGLRTPAIPERFWGDDSRRGTISSVCTFTFIYR